MALIACTSCGARYKVPDAVLGRKVRCKKCSETFVGQAIDGGGHPRISTATPVSDSGPPRAEIGDQKPSENAAQSSPAGADRPAAAASRSAAAILPSPGAPPPIEPASSPDPASALPTQASTNPSQIKWISGKMKGETSLLFAETTFGKSDSCHYRLPDGVDLQATIRKLADGWHIRDSGKGRGVPILVNSDRSVDCLLRDGDQIRIGPTLFRFIEGDGKASEAPAPTDRDQAADPGEGIPEEVTSPDSSPPESSASDSAEAGIVVQLAKLVNRPPDRSQLEAALALLLKSFPDADRAILWGSRDEGTAWSKDRIAAQSRSGAAVEVFNPPDYFQRVHKDRKAHWLSEGQGGQSLTDLLAETVMSIKSAACLPLFASGSLVGLLYLDSAANVDAFPVERRGELYAVAPLFAGFVSRFDSRVLVESFESRLETYKKYFPLDLVDRMEARGRAVQTQGEMKKLSIMFTDIRGFTAMSEGLNPKDLIRVMNHYFESMVSAIQQYEGFVNKFIGDAIMAFWGAPEGKSIDSLLAVKSAMRMQRNMYHINRAREAAGEKPFFMGIGIHTGNAVVGNIGSADRKEYSALGDTINTASRIESVTKTQGLKISEVQYRIFISESTYLEVKDHINAEPLPPLEVKGKAEPLNLYSLVGVLEVALAEEEALKKRYRVKGDVSGIFVNSEAPFSGTIEELSRQGAVLTTMLNCKIGDELVIDFPFSKPGEHEVPIVIRKKEGTRLSVHFQSLSTLVQRNLEDYITSLSRKVPSA